MRVKLFSEVAFELSFVAFARFACEAALLYLRRILSASVEVSIYNWHFIRHIRYSPAMRASDDGLHCRQSSDSRRGVDSTA